MSQPDFQTRFCEEYRCAASEYARRAFRKCLYPHARLLVFAIRLLAPRFFLRDDVLIKYVGLATEPNEVQREVDGFQDSNRQRWNLLRDALHIRVSGRRVMRLCDMLRRRCVSKDAPYGAVKLDGP